MEKLIRLLILFLLVSCVKIIPVDNTEKYVYNLKYTIEYRTPKTIDFNFQSKFDDLKYECNYYRIENQSELTIYSEKEELDKKNKHENVLKDTDPHINVEIHSSEKIKLEPFGGFP